MNNSNEESERKSWDSNKSESYEQMPMYNYNPCMYCPMMYGNMDMQSSQMIYGGIGMDIGMGMGTQSSQMMPQYGIDDSREQDLDRHYHGHPFFPFFLFYLYNHGHYHHHR